MRLPDPAFRLAWVACLPVAYAASGCTRQDAGPAAEYKLVPLKVNVLKGVSIDDDELVGIVREANAILRQANIRLVFGPDDVTRDASDQNNDDGRIDQEEDQALIRRNLEELDAAFGAGRGYKVNITTRVHGSRTRGGATYHKFPVSHLNPFVLPSIELRGNDLAHEVCHAFTLSGSYRIDDATVAVDGHHPASTRNLMWGIAFDFPTERGTELTGLQREECNKGAKTRGRSAKLVMRTGEVVPNDTKHCAFTDEPGDVDAAHVDLYAGFCFAESSTADLDFTIGLAGLHPDGEVASTYEVLLNTDADDSTGVVEGGVPGVDRIVRISLSGAFPFSGAAGSMTAELVDGPSGRAEPLGAGSVERLLRTDEALPPEQPASTAHVDAVRQSIPLARLGRLAARIPVGVRATDAATGATDDASFVFPFDPALPRMEMSPTTGRAGDRVTITGRTFPPAGSLVVLVGDAEVVATETRGDGTFLASFQFPDVPAGSYVVTARVPGRAFDFSVFTVR